MTNYISWQFTLFFLTAMALLLPRYKYKKGVLFILNLLFCFAGGVLNFLVIAFFGMITFWGGRIIGKYSSRNVFVFILMLSLTPLLFFKYADFIFNTFLGTQISVLSTLATPIGISFYTLQGVGYLIDVYKRHMEPTGSFTDYFIYLSLFTCAASGPINRAEQMLKQIRAFSQSDFEYDRCVKGLQYILLGLFLKLLIAGRMAQIVATPFANVNCSQGAALLIASVCYTIEIFCDFCGYSYMAFGLSKVIGLNVIQNFRMPYASRSITEFWRRWHISLSSWLTEYIYIPLGGNRCSKCRSAVNVLITFAVSGLWHGANWTFLVWGLLNGLLIIMERITGFARHVRTKVQSFLHWLITMILVNVLWIFFRASTLADAFCIVGKILRETIPNLLAFTSAQNLINLKTQLGVTTYEFCMAIVAGAAFLLFEWSADRKKEATDFFENRTIIARWAMYIGIIMVTFIFGATGKASEFIYAQF